MQTNVLFGGLPLNVAITEPVLNSGYGSSGSGGGNVGGGSTTGGGNMNNGANCICPSIPGNGIGAIYNGQNPVPVVALAPLPAFVAVVMGVGGVILADITVPAHRDIVWGVNTTSVNAGQLASVIWGGPVVNNINGTGGWNFVFNQPVYVTAGGVLSQTPPVTGWVDPIGFALSMNTVQLFPARVVPLSVSLNPPVVATLPFSTNVVVNLAAASVFDLVLTGNTTLSFAGGVDGRIVTLRIAQGTGGAHAITLDTNVVPGTAYTPVPPSATGAARYQIQYDGASGKYVVLSSTTFG
jgi:hypothetical protein